MKIKRKKQKQDKVVETEPQSKDIKKKKKIKEKQTSPEKGKKSKKTKKEPSIRSNKSTSSKGSSSRAGSSSQVTSRSESEEDSRCSDSCSEDEEDLTSNQSSYHGDVENQERPWFKQKKTLEPIVSSCCGFCSLGAGSLFTAIIYIAFGIGFMIYRIGDFKKQSGKRNLIYEGGENFHKDIWRLILVGGITITCLSLLGALVLLIASCLFGQKEHYSKMRTAVIIWSSLTAFSILCNIGEGVFVILMPKERIIKSKKSGLQTDHFEYKEIKDLIPTIWGLTGAHALFYIYLVIVLISYLRLLRYKTAPKVGNDQKGEVDTANFKKSTKSTKSIGPRITETERGRKLGSDGKAAITLPPVRSSASLPSRSSAQTPSDAGSRTPKSLGSRTGSQSSISASNFRLNGNTYINWPHFDDDSALGPSPTDDVRENDDEQSLPESSVYDMPPGSLYDETPLYDVQQRPPPIPKTAHPKKGADLNKIENSTINLSNSALNEEQEYANTPAPSETGESTYSTPRSQPIVNDTPKNRSRASSVRSVGKQQPEVPISKSKEKEQNPKVKPEEVTTFFKKLAPDKASDNPLEEMFRIFGGDLCSQHPENCGRYLRSYKDVRSKTSHLSSLRDPYEFERFGGMTEPKQQVPPQKFALNNDPYSLNSSVYNDFPQFQTLPSRHPSHKAVKLEPEYSSRPSSRKITRASDLSRGSDCSYLDSQRSATTLPPRYPSSRNQSEMDRSYQHHQIPDRFHRNLSFQDPSHVDPSRSHTPYQGHSNPYSIYSSFSPGQSIYYDDQCSTCYGDYYYGGYSDYTYGSYYRPPKTGPAPIYAPKPRSALPTRSQTSSYNPSMSQFSVMSDLRRPGFNRNVPTWIPVDTEDNYSLHTTQENKRFNSNRCRSLPNLSPSMNKTTPSSAGADVSFLKPMGPEFTLPSPREVNKLNRSSSWSNFHRHKDRASSLHRKSSSRPRSSLGHGSNNYSGYHTGDLRRRTSHTSYNDGGPWKERSSSRNSNLSVGLIRSNRPHVPPRRPSSSRFEDQSRSSSFLDDSCGRPPLHKPSSRSMSRTSSQPSFSRSMNSQGSSHHSSADRYRDKNAVAPPSAILHSRESSLVGSKSPFLQGRSSESRSNNLFQRSRSVRHPDQHSNRTTSKQVKFGSTPDLRHI